MTAPRAVAAQHLREQGLILEALAEDGAVLTGTLERLGRRFGLAPEELRACLLELAYAGWITIGIQPFGHLAIQLDRTEPGSPPVTMRGQRSVPAAWRL